MVIPKKHTNHGQCNIQMDRKTYDRFEAFCVKTGRSKKAVIKCAVDDYLKSHDFSTDPTSLASTAPKRRRKRKKLESVGVGRARAYVSIGEKSQRIVRIKDGEVIESKIQYIE